MNKTKAAKPLINWVSPLPPQPTEIANYTARLLPVLAAHFDVRLWSTDEGWDPELEQHAEVHFLRQRMIDGACEDWCTFNQAAATFCHVGNNPRFHGSILDLVRKRPCVVVLHDLTLHHMVQTRLDSAGYLARMQASYGEPGREGAEGFFRGEKELSALAGMFPFTHLALESEPGGALGVIVHGNSQRDALIGTHDSALADLPPVFSLPLPFDPSPLKTVRTGGAAQESKLSGASAAGVKDKKVQLVQFGHLGPNRRLFAVFEALSGLKQKDRFRFDIFGTLWDKEAVEAAIEEYGLSGIVNLRGFAAEADLDDAIHAADLALNLRYPTMGEASASQLRIWAAGTASLVTRADWYAAQPKGTVGFVSPETEVLDIRRHLTALLDDPTPYRAMGKAGLAHLTACHGPELYVQGLESVVAHLPELWRRHGAAGLADRMGACLRGAPPELRLRAPSLSLMPTLLASLAAE